MPAHGRAVIVEVTVRRFRCAGRACPRRIFAERLAHEAAQPFARRTVRLDRIVHYCGLALGGRPAARLARRLMLPVSRDTLLRAIRRQARCYEAPLRAVGIDDWAWKRGQRYGTLICDLERRCVVDLLPDRDAGTVATWLTARPGISIIARDRGGGYGQASREGAPDAIQVADRWHLMENASWAPGRERSPIARQWGRGSVASLYGGQDSGAASRGTLYRQQQFNDGVDIRVGAVRVVLRSMPGLETPGAGNGVR